MFINASILATSVTCKRCMRFVNNQMINQINPVVVIGLLVILLIINSCSVADKIEDSHYILWDYTKALKTVEVGEKYATLESFSNPRRTYKYKCNTLRVGDTVMLNDSIKPYLKIKKVIRYDENHRTGKS